MNNRKILIPRLLPVWGTSTMPDLIFADGFESGDTGAWSQEVGTGFTVTSGAALVGSYGLSVDLNNDNARYLIDQTPDGETHYRVRFYLDTANITTMANGDAFMLLRGVQGTSSGLFNLIFRSAGSTYQVYALALDEAVGYRGTSLYALSAGQHYLELEWQNLGGTSSLSLWIDGMLKQTVSGLEAGSQAVDEVWFGPWGGNKVGTTGALNLDAFQSQRVNYIGPVP